VRRPVIENFMFCIEPFPEIPNKGAYFRRKAKRSPNKDCSQARDQARVLFRLENSHTQPPPPQRAEHMGPNILSYKKRHYDFMWRIKNIFYSAGVHKGLEERNIRKRKSRRGIDGVALFCFGAATEKRANDQAKRRIAAASRVWLGH
jgi:hypothetical protein